ncbi:MAG TPA: CRISPR-associated endonuclease Cas2 [Hyphomonadaceae bacterium]|jgi:CRISPR-associated protein Cas2|nr:CRISPR-associated endonuclease Cas2 [Hyphomonadaceae bacterium]
MWVIAMFDLPTDTPKARKAYARFRKDLLEDGFTMMQFSVYSRHCASTENADVHVNRMAGKLPPAGEVRFLTITDKQFGRIRVFWGRNRAPTRQSPAQLEFF